MISRGALTNHIYKGIVIYSPLPSEKIECDILLAVSIWKRWTSWYILTDINHQIILSCSISITREGTLTHMIETVTNLKTSDGFRVVCVCLLGWFIFSFAVADFEKVTWAPNCHWLVVSRCCFPLHKVTSALGSTSLYLSLWFTRRHCKLKKHHVTSMNTKLYKENSLDSWRQIENQGGEQWIDKFIHSSVQYIWE